MKKILFFLLIPYICFASNAYYFESLSNNASTHIAPADLQKAMVAFTKDDFIDCKKQLNLSHQNSDKYFSAIPISISKAEASVFLVFPSKHCFAFFGAHSVQFWIVSLDKNKQYNLLLSARQDGIEILSSFTNGFADLNLIYGNEKQEYHFNGKIYVPKT
jgi:hypothetical protein